VNQDADQPRPVIYAFAKFRVDPAKRLVFDEQGEPLPLKAKAFETLVYLIRNSERIVERDELLSAIWPDTIVEENNLTQHISALRRILGDKPDEHRYIATVPGRGYKFVAEVAQLDAETQTPLSVGPERRAGRLPKPSRSVLAVGGVLVLVVLGSAYFFWNGSRSNEAPRSIAVLPFKPLVTAKSDESLEMGMADTLISKLAQIDGLVVRPLTAVRRFNTVDHDSIEAGRMLGVDAVLDGGIQLDNDRVRISARLLRVADSRQLWSGQFDERLTDLFTVQDSISERVASALQVHLAHGSSRRQTNNAEAYQLYARGRYHSFKLTPQETTRGLEYFQKAIEIDPGYALAYAGASDAYRSLALSAEYPPKETLEKSITAAKKAIELDDRLPEGHVTLGIATFWYARDWQTTETELRTALELDPNSAIGHIYYAHFLSNMGRHAEAVEEAGKARAIDPVSPFVSALEGLFLMQAGRPDEAIAQYTKASEIDPNFWMPHMFAARAFIDKKMFHEAEISAHRATELAPAQSISMGYESYAAAKLGNREKARTLLEELLQRSAQKYVPPYHVAIAYMGMGDRENTLTWLERGVAEHDTKVVFLKVERVWDEIRSESRFIKLIERMNLQ
jgi:DNA-binding winged helix-turn-helix (wHTH) protein/TolB-like protein/Tfp pilus assembly protein PilF